MVAKQYYEDLSSSVLSFKWNNQGKFFLIAEFAYNNSKNTSTGHMSFEFNCGDNPQISYKDNIDFYSKFMSAKKLSIKLKKLMIVCYDNFYHI